MSRRSMAPMTIILPNPASRVWPGPCGRRSRSIRARPARCLPPRASLAVRGNHGRLHGSRTALEGRRNVGAGNRALHLRARRLFVRDAAVWSALDAAAPDVAGAARLWGSALRALACPAPLYDRHGRGHWFGHALALARVP